MPSSVQNPVKDPRGPRHLLRAVSAAAASVVITMAVKRFHVCLRARE